jgi:erythritol kinase
LRVLTDRHETNGVGELPVSLLPFVTPRTSLAVSRSPGSDGVDWLVGLGVQLLADAGLIGIGRDELLAILERKAAQARPGALLVAPFVADHGLPGTSAARARAHVLGLGRETTIYDLMRGLHEGQGFAARTSHAALGPPPAEIRLIEGAGSSPLRRTILAACMGAPIRVVGRAAPGAAGAALLAAVALGHYGNPAEATGAWVSPWLAEPDPVSPELQARYAQLYPIQCGARPLTAEIAQALDDRQPEPPPSGAQMALAPLSIGRIAPVTLRDSSDAR